MQIARAYRARVFTTVSPDKREIVQSFGALPIDYRSITVDEYVTECTGGKGFDIVFDTVGGATLDASFLAVKRYTGHVVSCLGWGSHSLAPLSFRGATYSGVFTLSPLITGKNRAHHGEILAQAASLAEWHQFRPLLNQGPQTSLRRARSRPLISSKPMESKTKPDGSGAADGAELLVTGVLKLIWKGGSFVLLVSIPMQYSPGGRLEIAIVLVKPSALFSVALPALEHVPATPTENA